MTELLLKILGEGLKAWNTSQGKKEYNQYLRLMRDYNEELDKKSRFGRYSQLKLDRVLRDINLIADAYYKYLTTKSE